MDLVLHVEEVGAWAVLRAVGEVDVATAPALRSRLLEVLASGRSNVVLDLDEVPLLDSTGLGVIVSGLKRARTQGGDLRVATTRPALLRAFELTRLDRALDVVPTVADAVADADVPAGEG